MTGPAERIGQIATREAENAERLARHAEAETWRRVAELCRQEAAAAEERVANDLRQIGEALDG